MKSFISKNWEKILIFIACVLLVVIFVGKITAEKTLIEDYGKYGKSFVSSSSVLKDKQNLSNTDLISGDLVSGDMAGTVSNLPFFEKLSGLNPELFKIAMVVMTGILGVVVITSIPNMFDKKDTKKKK